MADSSSSSGHSCGGSIAGFILAIIGLVSLWPDHPVAIVILGLLWLLGF